MCVSVWNVKTYTYTNTQRLKLIHCTINWERYNGRTVLASTNKHGFVGCCIPRWFPLCLSVMQIYGQTYYIALRNINLLTKIPPKYRFSPPPSLLHLSLCYSSCFGLDFPISICFVQKHIRISSYLLFWAFTALTVSAKFLKILFLPIACLHSNSFCNFSLNSVAFLGFKSPVQFFIMLFRGTSRFKVIYFLMRSVYIYNWRLLYKLLRSSLVGKSQSQYLQWEFQKGVNYLHVCYF